MKWNKASWKRKLDAMMKLKEDETIVNHIVAT
jgi:hypothetical protein